MIDFLKRGAQASSLVTGTSLCGWGWLEQNAGHDLFACSLYGVGLVVFIILVPTIIGKIY